MNVAIALQMILIALPAYLCLEVSLFATEPATQRQGVGSYPASGEMELKT
jgi:hypothetical protein